MGFVPLSALGLREAIFEDDVDRDDFMVAFQIRRDSILSMLTTHVLSGYF
jgi:hypothetical protein